MYQAHAHQLLNQKDEDGDTLVRGRENPLLAATRRLVSALDRLEGNLEQVVGRQPAHEPEVFARENEELRLERDKLDTAIAQLQGQYDGLHQVASAIYGKLDDSIKRLSHIIGQ